MDTHSTAQVRERQRPLCQGLAGAGGPVSQTDRVRFARGGGGLSQAVDARVSEGVGQAPSEIGGSGFNDHQPVCGSPRTQPRGPAFGGRYFLSALTVHGHFSSSEHSDSITSSDS